MGALDEQGHPESSPGAEGTVYLPVGVERLRVYGRPPGPLWAHARLVEQTPTGVAADVHLLDESERVVVEVQRFRARVLDAAPPAGPRAGREHPLRRGLGAGRDRRLRIRRHPGPG